ncbi:protein phosphatase type 1 complex subunit Hex2/Reg1 [Trichoderma gamsii]|uniref:Protein phosphatase type 1 complex subunit Hex2/Reg1 n=1 Tax=Trichoderma gamsii TaxID=398673 RepID=A0A2P4Z7F6_9HYPO|nr:protein phosphatase type 1 complex subunit Hex2/Reg1 [Trichoderma gamsii]PON20210.1 protein phosphatase type 1 complex subunit Hex2/Reg1 [Trichoderma gamsii]
MTSSGIVRYAQDDMSTRLRPSSYVDYFSHDWTQEAIQKSWKYIASNSNELDNAARLGNASLRIWIKHMNKLKTIPPEALNWYKDYDVTWLYGPLQTNDGITSNNKTISSSSNKKPSLKKRSTLDTISQGSFFSTSIDQLKQINGITRVTSIQFRLLPSSILRLLFSTGERKHVRFSQEITVYSY